MGNIEQNDINHIIDNIMNDYSQGRDIDSMEVFHQPDMDVIIDILHKLLRVFYPGFYREKVYKYYNERNNLAVLIEDIMYHLQQQIAIVLHNRDEYLDCDEECTEREAYLITKKFFNEIPKIRAYLDTDMQAAFDGDPAANGKDEIVLCYPGLLATTINRIAHELFVLDVPLIPRMMSEYAHSRTGVDIHPGAVIGKYFFIDHATGIVIGSTTKIGDHVKVYQGVTLGALSTRKGQLLHGVKRHPTIEDNVTIYAGASVLGGDTVIGHDTVIGSNAFITSSVAPNSRISIENKSIHVENQKVKKEDLDDSTWFYII
ncbi:serine O-acetyltransferase [Intestinibaculum porci]|jgi:serine O-acetyltransferase|uniref:serine O-acetyltransferase n=1 Tax=Intestinibaculum porci TaxID=2487118 RepID=UPI00240940C8|nr:serine acetyltransferase [Intestinibaculum porci]MDD6349129.1 serine acetyltransferase [Intestinibaculum porci]MDD6421571.1 serine acetyltransferase [Intestinibaculum porci]